MLYYNIYVSIISLSSSFWINIGSSLSDVLFMTFFGILFVGFAPLLIFAISVEYMYNTFDHQTGKKFYIYAALIGVTTFIIDMLFSSGIGSISLNLFYSHAVMFIIYLLATLSVYGFRNLSLRKQ